MLHIVSLAKAPRPARVVLSRAERYSRWFSRPVNVRHDVDGIRPQAWFCS